jgi:hypothetical protein
VWHSAFVGLDHLPADLPIVNAMRGREAFSRGPAGTDLPFHLANPAVVLAAESVETPQPNSMLITFAANGGVIAGIGTYERAVASATAEGHSFVRIVVVTGLPGTALVGTGGDAPVRVRVAKGAAVATAALPGSATDTTPADAGLEETSATGDLGQQTVYLEDELLTIVGRVTDRRGAAMTVARWGWNGAKPQTLEALGQEHGITSERVRQIAKATGEDLAGLNHRSAAPTLERALLLIAHNLPTTATGFAHMLQEAGLTRGLVCPAAIERACALLQRHSPFTRHSLRRIEVVIPAAQGGLSSADAETAQWTLDLFTAVVDEAKEQVRRSGVTRIADVVDAVSTDGRARPQTDQVIGALAGLPGC